MLFRSDSDQETPNTQVVIYEYGDGTLIECEIRNLYTNLEQDMRVGNFFYGSEGWMYLQGGEFRTFFGRKNEPGPVMTAKDLMENQDKLDRKGVHEGVDPHFVNFIDSVRTRKWQNLNADILEGHMSTTMCHLGNISYRTGRALKFNPYAERFINDTNANNYLTREYRHPYIMPDKI